MGTTKDPEGFRRHSSGRRQVLGTRPAEEGGRRGCGLGAALVLIGLGLGAAVLGLSGERGAPVEALATAPAAESPRASQEPLDVADPVAPERRREAAPAEGATEASAAETHRRRLLRATWAERVAPSPATLPVQLLRGWSDVPLADVEVLWIGRGDLSRMRGEGLTVTTVEFEPVLRALGRSARSDAQGRVPVAADGAHLLVLGESFARELEVQPAREGPTRVRVFAPRTLAVDVVDWRGRPAHGFPVHLWRVDAGGEPQVGLHSTSTSQVSGVLRIEDVDTLLAPALARDPTTEYDRHAGPRYPDLPPLEPTRVRVALEAGLAPNAWQEVDLARDPLPHVRLQLPPLGELRVVVAQADGVPVTWPGYVELRGAESSGGPDRTVAPLQTSALRDGRAAFANLRFERDLRVVAVRAEGAKVAKGEELSVPPLTPDEPEREVVLPDVASSPRLFVRPLDPEGRTLPGAWVGVHVQVRRPLSDAERRQLEESFERRQLEASIERRLERGIEGRVEGSIEGRTGSFSGRVDLVPPAEREIPTHTHDTWTRILRCDAFGQLAVPLPEVLLAQDRGQLRLTLMRDGVTLASQAVTLERGAAWADLRLGALALSAP